MINLKIIITLLALVSSVLGKGSSHSKSKPKNNPKSSPPPVIPPTDAPLNLTISIFESSDCKTLSHDVELLQAHKHLIPKGPDISYHLSRDMTSYEEIKFFPSDGNACDGDAMSKKRKLKAKGKKGKSKCYKVDGPTVSPLWSGQIMKGVIDVICGVYSGGGNLE